MGRAEFRTPSYLSIRVHEAVFACRRFAQGRQFSPRRRLSDFGAFGKANG